jgi:Inorganic pyrophosphatase
VRFHVSRLVLCQEPVQPLALIGARAFGLMAMTDFGTHDDKVIAVATGDLEFSDSPEIKDLPQHTRSWRARRGRSKDSSERGGETHRAGLRRYQQDRAKLRAAARL